MIISAQLHTAITILLTAGLLLLTEISDYSFNRFYFKRSKHKRQSYECVSAKCVYGLSASLCKKKTE